MFISPHNPEGLEKKDVVAPAPDTTAVEVPTLSMIGILKEYSYKVSLNSLVLK